MSSIRRNHCSRFAFALNSMLVLAALGSLAHAVRVPRHIQR